MNSASKKDYNSLANAYIDMYMETSSMKPQDQDDDAENAVEIAQATAEIEGEGGKLTPAVKQANRESKKFLKTHSKRT